MSTTQIQENGQPFWAKSKGFITGRDTLGVQNTSIMVYSLLLPGMTNLTLRLRYYSFYCWILKAYHNLNQDKNVKTLEHHYNYVRRSELILACIMVNLFPDEQSVIGSDFVKAESQIRFYSKNRYYKIKDGADKIKKHNNQKLYWDFRSGALGQYYAGTLQDLDLIETSAQFFCLTSEGMVLANNFEESVPSSARNRFLNCIATGTLSEDDINELGKFCLNAITPNTNEYKHLVDLILCPENITQTNNTIDKTRNRRESIKVYLHYIANKTLTPRFEDWIFSKITTKEDYKSALFGWYYYYLTEIVHFALETIFWAFLEALEGRVESYQTYIDTMAAELSESLNACMQWQETETVNSKLDQLQVDDLLPLLDQLKLTIKNSIQKQNSLGKSVHLILCSYKYSREYEKHITEFETGYDLHRQPGCLSNLFSLYINNNADQNREKFSIQIIATILQSHLESAYRKMSRGDGTLLKFMTEDGLISHIQTISPRHTNPRTRALSNILTDLSLIDAKRQLTKKGQEYLKILK